MHVRLVSICREEPHVSRSCSIEEHKSLSGCLLQLRDQSDPELPSDFIFWRHIPGSPQIAAIQLPSYPF